MVYMYMYIRLCKLYSIHNFTQELQLLLSGVHNEVASGRSLIMHSCYYNYTSPQIAECGCPSNTTKFTQPYVHVHVDYTDCLRHSGTHMAVAHFYCYELLAKVNHVFFESAGTSHCATLGPKQCSTHCDFLRDYRHFGSLDSLSRKRLSVRVRKL